MVPRPRAIPNARIWRCDGTDHVVAAARIAVTPRTHRHFKGSCMSALVDVKNLTMRFGGLTAVDKLSFQAQASEITAIIGPNGAGKTTVFNCLTGFYPATRGRMTLTNAQ